MPTNFEKLKTLLGELFQLDQADLDFGIYRIMNQRRAEINTFLSKDLLPQVKAAFAQYQPADKRAKETELANAIVGAQALGMDPNLVPKVKQIREDLALYSVDIEALENEVYSHLYNFFRRYYDNGDFISMRRYKEGVYAIPYEGEEVKLHWANADQYYIKTSEYFRDYSFKLPSGRLAHFKVVEAETEKDNVKTAAGVERRFSLAAAAPVQVEAGELILRFEYRADPEKRDQKVLNNLALAGILAQAPAAWAADLQALAPTEADPRRTLLAKHLNDYTARNTFDYFIHKDLGGFLRRELDFYIKNEVMRLDDIESEAAPRVEQYLSKIKALRQVAHKIITFLAQIENFQKKLWLKKKFVVETNYCITLDRVPEELYPEICANDAQREEWVRLFAIDEIKGNLVTPGYSVPLTINFLKANQCLVLDTLYFPSRFKANLFTGIDDIDTQFDGLLINSENYQGLSFLSSRYSSQVDCIYNDPPYNTETDSFIYKDTYRSSSWLSFMEDRILLMKTLSHQDTRFFCSIDDRENSNLLNLLLTLLGRDNYLGSITWEKRTKSQNTQTSKYMLQSKVEYIHSFALATKRQEFNLLVIGEKKYDLEDSEGKYRLQPIEEMSSESIRGRNSMIFEISGIWPREGKQWQIGKTKVAEFITQNKIIVKDGKPYIVIRPEDEDNLSYQPFWSHFFEKEVYGTAEKGLSFVDKALGFGKEFNTVKPLELMTKLLFHSLGTKDIVLDAFAGSGTTGNAVINLNGNDKGSRKYILIELEKYFYSLLIPRIKKIIYSKDWKDGIPITRQGASQCFKYLRLESYEDTLNNLALKRRPQQQLALEQAQDAFQESYMLSYMLDSESQDALLNVKDFVHPFDYQLNIATGTVGESKPTKVDLVETFNYLIGLRVQTMQAIRGFRVVSGLTPAGEKTLIIWRDLEEKSNADLEAFFRKQDYNPKDMEFDLIYVNGDNHLENLRRPDETWKVRLIEEEFLRRMFEEN